MKYNFFVKSINYNSLKLFNKIIKCYIIQTYCFLFLIFIAGITNMINKRLIELMGNAKKFVFFHVFFQLINLSLNIVAIYFYFVMNNIYL